MKKIIALMMLVFIGASTAMYAQESKSENRRAERKAQRDAEKAREKREEARAYADAVQAINNRKFVLEADRITFKRGRSAFVTSNTNFVLLNGEKASVQVAFNGPYAGPNGIGGITVDGRVGEVKTATDKKGNVTCSFRTSFYQINPRYQQCIRYNQPEFQLKQIVTGWQSNTIIRIERI